MDSDKKEIPQQIGLELPDYGEMYRQWKEKQKKEETTEDTVIIIDIY